VRKASQGSRWPSSSRRRSAAAFMRIARRLSRGSGGGCSRPRRSHLVPRSPLVLAPGVACACACVCVCVSICVPYAYPCLGICKCLPCLFPFPWDAMEGKQRSNSAPPWGPRPPYNTLGGAMPRPLSAAGAAQCVLQGVAQATRGPHVASLAAPLSFAHPCTPATHAPSPTTSSSGSRAGQGGGSGGVEGVKVSGAVCKQHGRACVVKRVRRPGANQARLFFSCAVPG
jgi:hypothetical protein